MQTGGRAVETEVRLLAAADVDAASAIPTRNCLNGEELPDDDAGAGGGAVHGVAGVSNTGSTVMGVKRKDKESSNVVSVVSDDSTSALTPSTLGILLGIGRLIDVSIDDSMIPSTLLVSSILGNLLGGIGAAALLEDTSVAVVVGDSVTPPPPPPPTALLVSSILGNLLGIGNPAELNVMVVADS